MRLTAVSACVGLAASSIASAQSFTNGNFDTGDLSGWTVANTGNGVGAPGDVVMFDIDGGGPLGTSNAAHFLAGQAVFTSGVEEGVEMTQRLNLTAGVSYMIDFDVSAFNTGGNNAQGGVFSVIVDGTIIAPSVSLGSINSSQQLTGHLSVPYTPSTTGLSSVGIRITRHFVVGGTINQYVDNAVISGGGPAPCYANCDGSTITPILNVNDFICFQTKYAAGDTTANCDGSTIPPILNVNDFICFQTKYSQGCP